MNINTKARLTSINIRKEREGDEVGNTAIDIAFVADADEEQTAMFFNDPKTFKSIASAIWDKKGNRNAHGISDMKTENRFENLRVTLACDLLDPLVLVDFKLNKIGLSVRDGGRSDVSFRIQGVPSTHDIEQLATKLLGYEIDMVVESIQSDLINDE